MALLPQIAIFTGHGPFSIRNRIVFFTMLVTLIPALGLGGLFYINSHRVLLDKTEQELSAGVSQVEQRLGHWIKERAYDLRVFSNSFIVTENLERLINDNGSRPAQTNDVSQINDYLGLLLLQFKDYRRLAVFDLNGALQSQTPQLDHPLPLPADWRSRLSATDSLVGESNDASDGHSLVVAVPILSGQRKVIGLLAAELSLNGMAAVIKDNSFTRGTRLLLLHQSGEHLISSSGAEAPFQDSATTQSLFQTPRRLLHYRDNLSTPVIGIIAPLTGLPWGVVMERSEGEVFARINQLRNVSLLIALLLLTLIGAASFLLAQSILKPLKHLTTAAKRVSAGDLNVKLQHIGNDELGLTMEAFNRMVGQLKQSYDELETLSITDPLTGLANRKRIMTVLADHFERYRRHQITFSVLMIDIDHFKRINDQHGHLVGDTVLRQVGEVFHTVLRSIDIAGRYGGEEFLILLDQTPETEAMYTAERIRKAIEQHPFHHEEITLHATLSIGIATVNAINLTENTLIRNADDALYRAKHAGRNRCLQFHPEPVAVSLVPKKGTTIQP